MERIGKERIKSHLHDNNMEDLRQKKSRRTGQQDDIYLPEFADKKEKEAFELTQTKSARRTLAKEPQGLDTGKK